MFSKIVHWSGIVLAKAVALLHKADTDVAKYAPEIEKDMTEGANIADLFPGVGTEVGGFLNLASEVTGAFEKTLNFADADFQKLVQQVEGALPANSGMAVVLVPAQLKADAQQFFAQIKPTLDAVKAEAQKITGNGGAPAANGGTTTNAATSNASGSNTTANTDPKVITESGINQSSPK